MTDYDNIIYLNSKDKTIVHHSKEDRMFKKNEFIVKAEMFQGWKLKNEQKKFKDLCVLRQ